MKGMKEHLTEMIIETGCNIIAQQLLDVEGSVEDYLSYIGGKR